MTVPFLDGDYFSPEEHEERYAEARGWSVQLRIWSRKEIENFLLVPEAIARFVEAEAQRSGCTPDLVADEIDRIVESLRRDPIEDTIAAILHARDKKGGLPKANKAAREHVARLWAERELRWAVAPGKKVLSRLSAWSQEKFGPSFGPEQIARALLASEVDKEVIETISAITEARAFRPPFQMPRSP